MSRTKPGLVSEAMARNGRGNSRVNVPREYARAEWSVENPPSLVGLKLLTLMIAACRNDFEGFKEFPLSLLREVPALANVSRAEFKAELKRLMAVNISAPDETDQGYLYERFGVVIADARLVSKGPNIFGFGFIFGETFKAMVKTGEFYAVLDSSIILALRSRHSVLLYQFLASVAGQIDNAFIISLEETRRIFALPQDKFAEFKRFKRDVLIPACNEISEISNWTVTPTPVYSMDNGRMVDRIQFTVETKELPSASKKPEITASASADKKPRINNSTMPNESDIAVLRFWADQVKNGGKRSLSGDITAQRARDLIKARLVEPEELRARGVQF